MKSSIFIGHETENKDRLNTCARYVGVISSKDHVVHEISLPQATAASESFGVLVDTLTVVVQR